MPKHAGIAYGVDLSYIHDSGFGEFARHSATWLLSYFRSHQLTSGLVIDLGCGSGILAKALCEAGYDVLGFDISEAMIELAKRRVPRGEFHRQSFATAMLRPCLAVTAIGEVFNYLFDRQNSNARMQQVFLRVFKSLQPGGLFVFDGAEPGRIQGPAEVRSFTEGNDWACLVAADEDPTSNILTRKITSFRRVGEDYRREYEVHRLRLFDRRQILTQLRAIGFRVRTLDGYGDFRFPPGYIGFVARKP